MDKNTSILKYLYDVLASVKAIDIHLSSKRNYSEYISNLTVQRAIERELEIIGEAINKLLSIEQAISISYARLIVDMRNKIIHSYDSINNDVIWKVGIKDIPVLEQEINILITQYSSQQ
jgi:uncharacterized protein with HEPN domain